jgi:hypothetical protein
MKREMSQCCGIKRYREREREREVAADRPDIIIKNKKEKTCTLIDVAIPADRMLCKRKRKIS